MANLKIGVVVESLRTGLRPGIAKAAELGAQGIQIYTIGGDTHPDALSPAQRRELLAYVHSHGLVFSALCGDFGGFGLEKAEDNPRKIADIKKVMDLALDLGTNVVTTHIGTVPEDDRHPTYRILQEACRTLADYAARRGVTLAIETGPEKSNTLRKFIQSIDSPGLGVNYDPANLRMVAGEAAAVAARNLREFVVHTHAKDGIQLKPITPVKIHHCFAGDNPENINPDDYFQEVPLGEGQVDFPGYIKILTAAGYDGFYTIEREAGNNRVEDIRKGIEFLQKF